MALSAAALANKQARIDSYYAAETAILRNQEYEMADGRRLVRADLKEVRAAIKELEAEINGGSSTPVVRGRARGGRIMSR
ncbi:hypothetical protein DXH95_03045 [Sphingorhabdus pulchriflava]|uniref:Uncharacterized protein n=1 Tax=Sphingorhabdus pulchriflava TaxID=2292257 RepID=A0A371BFX7_9SPHN|nr:hypothetical protein [Sphingorhabdus pulchriflava]RDV06418.1 hypothetical protein DXH95_03045 [Sphingorhabdus pulchriflava]